LLTRSVDQRLSSDAARQLLEPVASQPVSSPPDPAAAAAAPGEANATGLYKPPTPTPPPVSPAAFSGQTGQPGATAPGGFGPRTFVPTGPGQPPTAPAAQGGPLTGGTEPFAPVAGGPVPGPPMYDPPGQGPPMSGPPGQGPPPVPTFNASWGAPPPPRRSKTPIILSVVGALVAIGGILAAVLLIGGSKSSSGPKDAADVVRRLLEAGKNQDLSTAQSLTCDPLHSELANFPTITSYSVGSGTVNGSSAEVNFTATSHVDSGSDESADGVAELQKQGDSWKVCDLRDASSSSGDTNGPEPTGTGLPSAPDFPTDTGSSDASSPSSPASTFCFTPSGSTPICVP
jgi:hypothetical protein